MRQHEIQPLLQFIDRRKLVLQGLFLVALTYLIYSPAFWGGLIFDDIGHLFEDRRIRTFSGLIKIWIYPYQEYQHQYYPLTSTTFWLMYSMWGFHTLGYHLVNIAFHTCNALLLWRLLSMLKVPGSYWAAMFFAVCPVNVQSVAWIIELKNVQSCFFYLASTVVFVRMVLEDDRRRWWLYVFSIVLFVFALLSKAATSSLPVGLLLILFWKRRQTFKRDVLLLIPFVLLGMSFALWVKNLEENFSGYGVDLGLSTLDCWALFGQSLWFYASQLVLPIDLRFIYPKWQVDAGQLLQWLPTVGVVLVLLLFVRVRKHWGVGPLTGLLYFVAAIGPLAFVSVAYMRFSWVANHWVYWASMGLLTLYATAVYQIFTHPQVRVAVLLLLVLAYGGRSWSHARLYKDSQTMWTHTLKTYPNLSSAHLNLANTLRKEDPVSAFRHYQLALMWDPYNFRAMFSLGTLCLTEGHPRLSRFYTTQALLYRPNHSPYLYQNARCKIALGEVEEGRKLLEKIIEKNPDHFEPTVLLAHCYLIENKLDQAIELADRAVEIDPGDQQTLGIIGMIQARLGNYEAASENLLKAINLNPRFIDGLLNLGVINYQQGRLGAARNYFQHVLDQQPDHIPANEKIGLLYWEQGQWQQAFEHCAKAYDNDPARHLAGRRAADALGQMGQITQAQQRFEALYQQGDRSPQLLNELAWVLAIQGDQRALGLAEQTANLTDHKVALVLDTLALAHAAKGNYDQAIDWANRALSIAQASGESDLQTGIKQRLAFYQSNKTWTLYPRWQ